MLSEKIRDLRRKSGLSQEELAEKLDVSRQAVSKWETGAAVPVPEKLVELSDFFGVTLDFLMRENSPKSAGEKISGNFIDSEVLDNRENPEEIPLKREIPPAKNRKTVGSALIGSAVWLSAFVGIAFLFGQRDEIAGSSAINISLNGTGIAVIIAAACAVIGIILLASSKFGRYFMKIKTVSVIALFSASAALIIGFVIKTLIDREKFTQSELYTIPFGLHVVLNALLLIFPAVILAAVAVFILKKTRVLAICGGVFAVVAVGVALFSGNFSDGLIYAVPAALSAVVCGIFAVISIISKKRLSKT